MIADSLQAWVLNLPDGKLYFYLLLCGLVSTAGFVYAFVFFRRARIIEDTPTSRIRSAAQGYVELSGVGNVMDGDPVIAPLTTTPCTWYRYKVEKLNDKHSRVVASGTSDELFVLVGETGRCVVDPEGAVVTCATKKVWYESSYPSRRRHSTGNGGLLGRLGGRYRYTEERMHPGEPLYAIGMFMSVGGDAEAFNTDAEVREVLKLWKQNRAGLLKHFDADGDGELDVTEWEAVRKAATHRVRREQARRSVQPPTHIMKKPQYDNRPYLLSVYPAEQLVRRYQLKAAACFAGFLATGSAVAWMATLRLLY